MRIHIFNDPLELAAAAAHEVACAIRVQPLLRLGLPTGSTPIPLYAHLVQLHREEGLSFQQVTAFNLDEYLGLAPDDPNSYSYFMAEHLFRHIDIPLANTHIPHGLAADPHAEAARYDQLLQEPLDILLLGINALNGHIGFNEPGSPWDSPCRVVELTPETRESNAPHFPGGLAQTPTQAITMGIAAIMQSRRVFLMATGTGKAEIIQKALHGPQVLALPGSALQSHPQLEVYLDKAAASLL